MAVYWLTFRLEYDATYDQRLKKLNDAIDRIAPQWWVEPTSFLLFECGENIDGVAQAAKAAINPRTDMVLIGMSEFKTARVIGNVTQTALFDLMPFTKKA
jgi:hypothetical protein